MFFKASPWLWLYVRTAVVLGSELNHPEQQRQNHCFQFNRFHCSFEEAENYCSAQGGRLAYTWNQEAQELIWDFLERGKKWWIGKNLMLLGKHKKENNSADATTHQAAEPNSCTYLFRNSNQISSKVDSCSQGHYFICQTDAFSDPDGRYERNRNSSHLLWRPKKTEREVTMPGYKMTSGAPFRATCHQPAHANISKTLCHSFSLLPSIPPKGTTQLISVTSVPASSSLPGPSEPTKPVSVTYTRQPLEEITSSPKEDSHSDVLTTLLQASFQNVSDQVIDEIAGDFSKAVHGLQAHSKLQKACEVLQKLTASLPRFSESTQVSVIDSLIYLNEQLLRSPFQNSSDIPVTVCIFRSLSNIMEAGKASQQRPKHNSEQAESILKMPFLALGKNKEAFLQQIWFSESSVILTSSTATLMLSSQNRSTLPLSSYSLGQPAPVRLDFPSASALEVLLNKHPGVNVQIMLWRNASMEIHSTSLNMSTDHFVITVNVTSSGKSLIVCIEPESPLLMTLYLGFQYQPNHTYFHLNITLPKDQVWQKDEEYTWVLTPESLQYGIGTYYITAVLNKSQEHAQQTPTWFSVVTAVTQCYFWDHDNSSWKSEGCHVGPQSTVWRTQCLCNHLTYFGSDFFVVPRTVDVGDTIKLILRVTNNPVGVSLLASLLGFYMLIFVWAQRKDQADLQKVKVTVLADNDPSSQFCYLIQVYTGYRRRAATTAQVVVTLYGSEGRSAPHHLCDPQKAVFERGALDVFLLRTQFSLGELHSLRLWHDNSGVSPSWYVNQVIVIDVEAQRKWHFLCSCWLAVDLGRGERDRIFMPVSNKELFSFRYLFSSMIVEKFTQDYLWLSVATRHPWNQFTRVQRLTCCLTLLLCNMVINIMFWKINDSTTKRDEQVGPFAVTWSELFISIQTAVILFPINLAIGRLFQMIQLQEPLPQFPPIQASCLSDASFEPLSHTQIVEELKETIGFLLRRKTYRLSESERSSWSSCDINKLVKLLSSLVHSHLEGPGCHQQVESYWTNVVPENHHHFCRYLHRVLQKVKCHLSTWGSSLAGQTCNFLDAVSQLQKLQELLEASTLPTELGSPRETTSFPILSPEEGKTFTSRSLPRCLTYICWLVLGVTSLAAAFFTALYSLKLSKDQATSWVISLVLSVLQNIFISQPIKVISLALLFSLMLNRMPRLNKEKEQQTRRILALLAQCSTSSPGSRDMNNPVYVAPAMDSPIKCPERTVKETRILKLMGDIWVQILFLALLMTTVYSAQNSNRFYLHQAIWKSFSHGFSEIKILKHFYPWANRTLLPNLYGDYRGFITDGNSLLLGNVLLRQIRIPGAILFPTTVSPQEQVNPSHHVQEDTENYGVNWGPPDTNITKSDSIWHYQNQETVGSHPIQGEFAIYSGGGYVVRLGRNSSTAVRMLQHLEQNHWLDHCTRSLFVEFVVFNANVNLFCAVTLVVESNNVGAFFTSVRLDSLTFLQTSKKDFVWSVTSQVIYYLLICYHAFIQGRRLKQQRWRFFTRKRNVLDMSIILISFISLGLNMKLFSLLKKNMAQYRYDRDRFISFYEVIKVNSAVTYLVGFLVLLATLQLWNLLHHNPRLQVIGRTLSRSWDEVVGFLLVLLILLTGYAIAFNLLFGWSISDYRTFFSSAVTVVGLLMGITPHKEVIALDPVLGVFLILTSVILMGLVIINLFVSAILMTFGKERKSLKTRKEATLINVLLQKLSSLLGIQCNRTQ
ncbi:polycystic kidney disease protein 1-like 3 isoform X1 [Talpa occidentalis]|uniref:polycystic kidney disease protein 1-like 3 isoform X1 n=1 Tax=Talpa occidentalis TaxID=50954 RepID=UPI0023F64D5A|nr:polycystic kidney disease protein 1-like 3 isoform X1 [Talpa occidentalis]XP_054552940.1 polycystic kidney disease protein 1-like 3 isoform X1 [Talpa occidentalis]XP_054552941.1 polycystic kidney disease protein 1-like 3 isoform X1 [Talpa occidentalis]XP_054552942.1 polycystic kidney disease protein 1-like 3 isoform X1 [Talpa occidentalis]XP_054552943.1 polycystic kidney disease protein 1-like 3 isoform X1 [Talpa occidentalis]